MQTICSMRYITASLPQALGDTVVKSKDTQLKHRMGIDWIGVAWHKQKLSSKYRMLLAQAKAVEQMQNAGCHIPMSDKDDRPLPNSCCDEPVQQLAYCTVQGH